MYIFNFHHVEPRPKHVDRTHITITPEGLAQFIRVIRALGMEPVSLQQVLQKGGPQHFSARHLVLTFDDGFENFYHYAAPVLEAEQCPATVFVLAGQFSGTNDWDQANLPETERDQLLSLEQMKALSRSKYITFGSHGMEHRHCSRFPETDLKSLLDDSYHILSTELKSSFVPVFAYPWGDYTDTVLSTMTQSHYVLGLTTDKGAWKTSHNPYTIPRYSIYHRDGNLLVLLAKLLRNGIPQELLLYALESLPTQAVPYQRISALLAFLELSQFI